MVRIVSLLLVLVLAVPAFAGDPLDANDVAKGDPLGGLHATSGDPLDANDMIVGQESMAEFGCDDFIRWPDCVPCWTRCLFALMCDAMFDHVNDWDW